MPSARIRASVGRHRWLSRQPGSVGVRNGTGRSRDLRASRPVPLRRAPKTNSITQRLWFPMDQSRGARHTFAAGERVVRPVLAAIAAPGMAAHLVAQHQPRFSAGEDAARSAMLASRSVLDTHPEWPARLRVRVSTATAASYANSIIATRPARCGSIALRTNRWPRSRETKNSSSPPPANQANDKHVATVDDQHPLEPSLPVGVPANVRRIALKVSGWHT